MKKLNDLLLARNNLVGQVQSRLPQLKQQNVVTRLGLQERLQYFISTGEVKSYGDLAGIIDGSKSATARHYMRISRLRNKTLDDMALRDYSDTMRTEYNRCRYEVQRSLMLAHVLKIKGIGKEAVALWEKTFRKAQRYSLTMEAYVCAQHLCYEYAFRRRHAKFSRMSEVSNKLLQSLSAEHEAAHHYHRLVLLMKGKWYINPGYQPLTQRTSSLISRLAAKYRTHDLYSMHYRAQIYAHYASHDYRALLMACRQYRAYLQRHKNLQQDSRWAEIALHQMNGSISLGNFSTGIKMAEENRKYMRPENPNWFIYLENYFQLLMNAGEYMKAKSLYGEVMYSPYRKNMSLQQEDVWKVFLAYVQLALHSSGMISRFKPRHQFSILTTCKSDKAGLNFLIEAGMLIYMLIQANRADMEKHGERFKKYVKRHIIKSKMPRHYLFSKMLLMAVRHQHRSERFIRKVTLRYYQALKKAVSVKPHDFEANELIRFERLWEMLMQQVALNDLRNIN